MNKDYFGMGIVGICIASMFFIFGITEPLPIPNNYIEAIGISILIFISFYSFQIAFKGEPSK